MHELSGRSLECFFIIIFKYDASRYCSVLWPWKPVRVGSNIPLALLPMHIKHVPVSGRYGSSYSHFHLFFPLALFNILLFCHCLGCTFRNEPTNLSKIVPTMKNNDANQPWTSELRWYYQHFHWGHFGFLVLSLISIPFIVQHVPLTPKTFLMSALIHPLSGMTISAGPLFLPH